ncbi:MAG TPA: DsbA family oxidoreductase [Pseudoxanthomonas sp.]|nr:DsbA family oxidoreductase [Pseudoxanthomonas sp.]
MRVDVWSDPVCPWCWIGKHRFRRALELLGDDAPPVELHWHPFQLDPDAGTEPVPLRDAYAARFGGPEPTAQLLARTQATARAEGLPMDFDRGQVRVTTLPAHRLMWLAAREGDAQAVAEALFRAHFVHGRNLAQADALAEAGAAGGLAPGRVRAMLASDEGLGEVRARLAQARAMGIRAVPTFVVDGRHTVQGAQPPEAFARLLRQAMAEAAPPPAPGPGDDACGPDGACRA